MNIIRSPRSTYVAAFILGALIALLLVRPSRASGPSFIPGAVLVEIYALPDDVLYE
ncbi:MAG: hypothetical protein ABIR80_14705 [Opitutaceae bacterium]